MELRVWKCLEEGGVDVISTIRDAGYRCTQPNEDELLIHMPLGDVWRVQESGLKCILDIPNAPFYMKHVLSIMLDRHECRLSYGDESMRLLIFMPWRATTHVIARLLPDTHKRQERFLRDVRLQTICVVYCLRKTMGKLNKDMVGVIGKMRFQRARKAKLEESWKDPVSELQPK